MVTEQDTIKEPEVSTENNEENNQNQDKKDYDFSDFDAFENNTSSVEEDDEKKEDENTKEDDQGQKKPEEGSDENSEEQRREDSEKILVDEDIFSDSKSEEENDNIQEKDFDWKSHGQELGLEEFEENSKEAFNAAYNKKINDSRQQLNLDEFDPFTKNLIEFVHKEKGDPMEIFNDDQINEANVFLAKSAEEKYEIVRRNELQKLNKNEEEIVETIDSEIENMGEEVMDKFVSNVDTQIKNLRNGFIEEKLKERKEYFQEQENKKNQEVIHQQESLKNELIKIKSFMGFPLSDKLKKIISTQIDNGEFSRYMELNKEQAQLYGFLQSKYGSKALEKINEEVDMLKRGSYNSGMEKGQSSLHNQPQKSPAQQGHAIQEGQDTDEPGWDKNEFE